MKYFFSALAMLLLSNSDFAQSVGIGTATPNPSALLDITSTTKGVLVPRMTTAQRTAIATPVHGLLVFDNTTNTFWFYNGTVWTELTTGGNTGWALTGNSGTNPATNFIGTTDNIDLIFKRNNIIAGSIGATNTAYGVDALNPAGTGLGNTAHGTRALNSNTTGAANTANGYQTLNFNTTGDANTAIGNYALYNNTDGNNNTANGYFALYSNTTGIGNTANGYQSLYYNTTGDTNTAIGYRSLFNNTIGYVNTAIGYNSLYSNLSGFRNTAIGMEALYSNLSGFRNTANGMEALYSNTTGVNNVAIGDKALYSNTIASRNTAIGQEALESSINGYENTAVGYVAAVGGTNSSYNTALGAYALVSNHTGDANTALGHSALRYSTGNYNIAIGHEALYNLNGSGSNNIGIGNQAIVPSATGSGQVKIGNTGVLYAGIAVSWSITSDKRSKSDIKGSELGLDFIRTLNPVSYFRNNDDKKKTEYGFIAQEIEDALNKAGATHTGIITKDDAGMYSMRYNDLIAPIVKAIQEQQTIIQTQQKQIDELKTLVNKLTQSSSFAQPTGPGGHPAEK